MVRWITYTLSILCFSVSCVVAGIQDYDMAIYLMLVSINLKLGFEWVK
jgi:hypothetical protein